MCQRTSDSPTSAIPMWAIEIFLLNFRINYVMSVTSIIESNEKVIKKIQRWVKFPNIVFMISKSWYLIISMTTHKSTIQNYVLSHIKVLILKRKRKIIPSRPHHNERNIYCSATLSFLHALSAWLSRAPISTDIYLAKWKSVEMGARGWRNDVSGIVCDYTKFCGEDSVWLSL